MHIIGITGPTGCGKTTLLRVIEVHGGFTVDCDALYYEMLRENAPMRAALTEVFGDIFLPDGSLDRPKLGNRVFSDPDALARLNAIVYHHMGEKMRALLVEQAGQSRPYFAIDAINLIESGLAGLCDTTVAVLAPKALRLARIMARDGIPEDYARRRIEAQKPDEFYRASCGAVLENSGTPEAFQKTCEQWLQAIK